MHGYEKGGCDGREDSADEVREIASERTVSEREEHHHGRTEERAEEYVVDGVLAVHAHEGDRIHRKPDGPRNLGWNRRACCTQNRVDIGDEPSEKQDAGCARDGRQKGFQSTILSRRKIGEF